MKPQPQSCSIFGRFGRQRSVALVILFAFLAGPASGQMRDEAQRLLQERQERERMEALARPAPRVAGEAAAPAENAMEPAAIVEAGPAFVIRDIRIAGDPVLSGAEQQAIAAPFLGLALGPRRIDLLLRRLTAVYLERGYITTRAYVAPQNLASGVLEITVIPGTIEAVRFNDEPLADAARAAMPEGAGALLRLADVEQAVDQINRLRSQRAEARILPGQSPGTSVIALASRAEKPWRLSLGTDNYGQAATGQGRGRYGLEFDNLLGAWDAWSASHVESRDAAADLLAVSVPAGYGTFSYAYAQSRYRMALGAVGTSSGDSRSHTLGWNHVLDRDGRGRTALDATLTQRESRRRVNDIALAPQQQASLRLAVSRQLRFAAGSLSTELGYARGLSAFGVDADLPGLTATAPHNQFEKWDVAAIAVVALGDDWAWRGALNAIESRMGLPGAEQFFLGGAASVRGFHEGVVAGDRGHLLRNELQWTGGLPQAAWAEGARLDPFVFADLGVARLLADGEDRRLAALGFGLRAAWKMASLDLAWGHPIAAPAGISRESRVHAAFILQF